MITEKKFMLISIRDNKLKVKVDQYNPENNDAFQNTYMNDAPIHEELGLAMQNLLFHVEQLTHSKIPGLYVDGFYRQPSGNSEIINIYAGLRTDTTCPINLAVRVNTGKDAAMAVVTSVAAPRDPLPAGGQGFTAIIVAWLAQFNTFIMVAISSLLVFLEKGAIEIASQFDLNDFVSEMITGIILFFILGSEFFINYKVRFRGGKKGAGK